MAANEANERSYRTIDKSDWPHRGEWDNEPDKIQWVDEATDLDCLIVRGPSGALCGYVGVPKDHPWHGLDYTSCPKGDSCESDVWCCHSPESRIRVHGGITYANSCQHGRSESEGICHVPFPGRPDDVWWFGFDCAHAGDLCPRWSIHAEVYRNLAYVRGEVSSLAKQLAAIAKEATS